MSGDRILSVNHRFGAVVLTDTVSTREMFKVFYDFVANNPTHFTLHALQWGENGTGTDHHDEANPFGDDPFFVFSMPSHAGRTWTPFYLVQGAFGISLNGTTHASRVGSTPAKFQGVSNMLSFGQVGVSCCAVTGGNPWNGGTAVDGTDLKGDPVWVQPGGQTAWFFPRSNAPGGAFVTNKEDLGSVLYLTGNLLHRAHFVADLDHLFIAHDRSELEQYRCSYFGSFAPNPNVSVPAPFVAYMGANGPVGVQDSVQFGVQPVSTVSADGGIAVPNGNTVSGMFVAQAAVLNGANYSPNDFHSPAAHDRYSMWLVGDDDTGGRGNMGHFLDGDIVSMVPQYLSHDVVGANLEVGLGSTALDWTWLAKWDEATTPGGIDRNGVQSTIVVP